jgi:hypothetical protein
MGGRASTLVCDWNRDGRKDLVLADEKGYYVCLNSGTDAVPVLTAPESITFNDGPVRYVRPNLGSFLDWDGDGLFDLIGCHFENTIRLYRNLETRTNHAPPRFATAEGDVVLRSESVQMISGVDVIDWNEDGDADILTGQGHGGSGLRFYERDFLESRWRNAYPQVSIAK